MLGAVLASLLAFAPAGCSDAPGGERAGTPPSPLLYEIASADGTVEGWMLGTIHALPDDTPWRTPAITRVMAAADLLVVEIGALDDRRSIAEAFAELAATPALPPLERRLPPELHPALADLLARSNLDSDSFATTESWAAALTLARADADGDPANGVDRALIRAFPSDRIRELEGVRGQLAIFDTLPESEQRDLLASVVRGSAAAKARAADLREAWRTGDEAALEAALSEGMMADPELREALLVGRNRRWIGPITGMLADTPRPLIAVGTAHLLGSEGLAALLEAEGYRVTRLP